MKKALLMIALVISFFMLCACGSSNAKTAFNEDPDAIAAASESVVMISVYDAKGDLISTGSGFPLFEEGIFITNCHVIKGGTSFTANTEFEMIFTLDSVVAADQKRDIAILKTTAKTGIEILKLGSSLNLQKGEKVVAIGSPLGLINTVSEGMYSNIREENGVKYLQFTAPISPGSSGGALFNNSGEVIGITSASFVDGQNLNLAVPIEDVMDVWENKEAFSDIETILEPIDSSTKEQTTNVSAVVMDYQNLFGSSVEINGYISSIYRGMETDDEIKMAFVFLVDSESDIWGNRRGNNFEEELLRCQRGYSAVVMIPYSQRIPLKNGDYFSAFGRVDSISNHGRGNLYSALREGGYSSERIKDVFEDYADTIAIIVKP